MRLGTVASLLLLSSVLCLPLAAAQAPPLPPAPEPDPGEAVALVCATVGGAAPDVRDALPVCPREEPAAPAAPGAEDPEAAAPPASPPAKPEDVQQLVAEVLEDAQKVPEDPASAPERVMSILATIVQFVRDLLDLPKVGLSIVGAGIDRLLDEVVDAVIGVGEGIADGTRNIRDAVGAAFTGALDATKEAVGDLGATIRALLAPVVPEAPVETPRPNRVTQDVRDTTDGLLDLARGEARQVLAEG